MNKNTLAALLVLLAVPAPVAVAWGASPAQIERGKYLAVAGNCESCHTVPGGQPYAGGRAIATPFGAVRSSNLTPDRATGIGSWSSGDFIRAMRDGRRPDGGHLYPAFPYPWFSRMTRTDLLALHVYLRSLPPVRHTVKATELPFPYGRDNMLIWNMFYLESGGFRPVAGKSALWNRGAYLVEGPGHCGACHTPKNVLGADREDEAYRGATLPDKQRAPSLRSDDLRGLKAWTVGDIVQYLKTGQNRFKFAGGEMAVIITVSTSNLKDTDLKAIAVYLKDAPGSATASRASP